MKDIFSILRVLFKMRLRVMMQARPGSKLGRFGLGAIMIFSFGILVVMWTGMLYLAATIAPAVTVLTVAFLASMIITLVFSVVMVFGEIFMSRDAEVLSALPLGGGTVFTAKFILVYAAELATTALIALPAVGAVGYAGGLGAVFYVCGVLAVLLLPMIPLCIATFFSLLLTRFSALIKHREKLTVIFGVGFTLAFVFLNQFVSARIGYSVAAEDFSQITGVLTGAATSVARIFPPAHYAASAAMGGLVSWILYAALSFGALALCVAVASRFYNVSLAAGREARKKGAGRGGLRLGTIKASSQLLSCLRREYLTTIRSATYAMNTLIGVVLFPLMLIIIPMSTTSSMSAGDLAALGEVFADLDYAQAGLVFAISYAASFFLCMTNLTAATSISREGKGILVLKSIPVPFRTQAYAKLIFAVLVSAATLVLSAAAALYTLPASMWLPMLLGGVCALIASVIPQSLGLMIDIARPKLNWTTEAEAVKQNANGVFGMLLGILTGIILSVPTFIAAFALGFAAAALICAVLTAAAAFAAVWLVGAWADSKLGKLEI